MTCSRTVVAALAIAAAGCGPHAPGGVVAKVALVPRFPTAARPAATLAGCPFASPLVDGNALLVADTDGAVHAIDAASGAESFKVTLPAPDGETAFIVATPALVGDRLIVAYHTIAAGGALDVNTPRLRHRLAAIDLAARAVDATLPPFDFGATVPASDGGSVDFLPAHQMARGEVKHAPGAPGALGRVYVTFGNVRDLQPWHGWLFEVDLDRWRAGAAPVSAQLLTTAESNCGADNSDGAREARCGGGLWAPSGPLVADRPGGGYDLFIAPGNGHTDPTKADYANTVLRTEPGLAFDAGCDAAACAGFDPDAPARACVESCKNLYVPRLADGEAPLMPESGACDGLGIFACWTKLDYADGSTPVALTLASGRRVLLYATKEGTATLVDAEHLGTLYDRKRLVAICGTKTDRCLADWAGMIVTQPALFPGAEPLAVIPTFMPDHTHEAGVVGVTVTEAGGAPHLAIAWRVPAAGSPEAQTAFRWHPSRAAIAAPLGGEAYAFVVEAVPYGRGRLWALRADGSVAATADLSGPGMRFVRPAVVGHTIYVNSCDSDDGPGRLEAFDLTAR